MKLLALLALVSLPLAAADEARLALMLKAQSEFDRVELAGVGQLTEAGACVQSQAAALSVAGPSEASLLHYRKGYCLLAEAALTRRPDQFGEAAAEFDRAVEAWPSRTTPGAPKNAPVEPVSSGIRALADIAHLEAAPDESAAEHARGDLALAVASPACGSQVMGGAFCQQAVQKGREWLGTMALARSDSSGAWDYNEAIRDFAGGDDGWAEWASGRQAFADRNYRTAVDRYRSAVEKWDVARHNSTPTILQALSPRPDFPGALADLGGAQLLAGNTAGSIATLEQAVHEDATRAHPLYLRARAKEISGDASGALVDYNLASRAAFASAKDLASGEAHLYRGILLYRRKDPARAEDEFSSALNFDIPAGLKADAQAWRHLAAVANGSCESSGGYLSRALDKVSPYFPKEEARAAMASCTATGSRKAPGAPAH